MKNRLLFLTIMLCFAQHYSNAMTTTVNTYRWRNDNGSESAATWKGRPGKQLMLNSSTDNIRLRGQVEYVSYASSKTQALQLWVSGPNGTHQVTSSSIDFQLTTSPYITDGEATTQQMTPGTGDSYAAGTCHTSSNISILGRLDSNVNSEYEYCIKPVDGIVDNANYDFYFYGTATGSYSLISTNRARMRTDFFPCGVNVSDFTSTTALSPCLGSAAAVTINSATLVPGTLYTANYTLSGSGGNTGTYTSAQFTYGSGTGSFVIDAANLPNAGPAIITINYISDIICDSYTPDSANEANFSVSAAPVITSLGYTLACEDKPLSLLSTVTGGTPGYSYFWTGTGFVSNQANPLVSATATTAANGTYQLIVTDANNCSATDSTEVTVNPLQPIVGSDTVTFGRTIALTNPVADGTWSTPTPWITKVTSGTGDVKGISAGVSQVSYTTTHGCVATHLVTVMSGTNACVGQSIVISDGLATGGTWSSSSNSIATVGINSGIITGLSAGSVTITHKLSAAVMTTTTVKVNPLAATSGAGSVCQGQTLALGNNTAGGGTWYSSNPSVAVVSTGGGVSAISGGNVTIYFTPVAGCVTIKTITVTPVAALTGLSSVCVGQTTTLSNAISGGTWSTSNGSMATVFNGVVGGVSASTPIISYKWPGGCYATAAISVKSLSAIMGGVSTICENATMTVTNATSGGGAWSSDYNFSVSPTGVVTGTNAGTGNIYFNANNGCIARKVATVTGAPVIFGTPSVCVGQTILLNSSMTGGTWSTSNGSKATVYNGIIGGVAAGTPTISYKMPGGCFGSTTVFVYALSAISGGSTSICPSGTTAYTNATAGGGAWSSSVPAVANINGSGLVTGAGATAGSKTEISFMAYANGCVATRTVTVVACRDGGNTTETEAITSATVFNVQLYPNPNKGTFILKGTIDMNAGDEANVEVVNMLGQVIYRSKANIQNGNIEEQVQLQGNLAAGTYILNLRTGSGNKLFHFVVGQ